MRPLEWAKIRRNQMAKFVVPFRLAAEPSNTTCWKKQQQQKKNGGKINGVVVIQPNILTEYKFFTFRLLSADKLVILHPQLSDAFHFFPTVAIFCILKTSHKVCSAMRVQQTTWFRFSLIPSDIPKASNSILCTEYTRAVCLVKISALK